MPRITRVYTRAGDGGSTRLGGGQSVPKDARRIEAYGTVDELNSHLGVARGTGLDAEIDRELERIQNELFHLGADLCVLDEDKARMPVPSVDSGHVDSLERLMDRLTAELGPLENFILPAGAPGAAQLHVARTVCRRAERRVVALAREEKVSPQAIRYLNRLSDALFVMARYENLRKGAAETFWNSRA